MKKYIYLLCTLFAISLYSCSNEEETMEGTSHKITVSFSLPGDTRTDVTTPATEAEKKLNQVDLYCFDYNDGVQGTLKKIIHLSATEVAQANPPIDLAKGYYFIEAIANENTLNLTAGTSNYEDFLKLTAATVQGRTNGLPMQGSNTARITNATTTLNIPFSMIRLVARIDVQNNVPGLTLTKATLENSVSESFYREDTESTLAQAGKLETQTNTSLTTEAYQPIFYTYEEAAGISGLKVSFEGTDAQGTLHKSLPIADFQNQNAQPAIKRNKLYVVTLDEVDGEIKADITVTDWDQASIDKEVTVGTDLTVTANDLAEGATVEGNNPATANDQVTINVPAEANSFVINTKSANIEVEIVVNSGSEWLSFAETRSLEQAFNISIAENASEASRTATFVVRNKLTNSILVTYTLIQAAAGKEPEQEPTDSWVNHESTTIYGAATLEQWADSEDAVGANGKSFFMLGTPTPAVDTSSALSDFDRRSKTYWDSSNDPSRSGYRMATKADWDALYWVISKAGYGGTYLTLNEIHYYITSCSQGRGQVRVVFQRCDKDKKLIGTQQTISFGNGGSTRHITTLTLHGQHQTRYWCAFYSAYHVDMTYNVLPIRDSITANSTKGIDWYAMRIRSIKNN